MRILHIHKYAHEQDGAGRVMYDSIALMQKRGHECAVFAMHDVRNKPSPWNTYFVSSLDTTRVGHGLLAVRQFLRAWWSKEAYKKTRAMIDAFHPHVIHAHNLYTHLSPSVLRAARDAGVPVVLTAHDYGYISANYTLFDGKRPLAPTVSCLRIARTRSIKGSFFATLILEIIVRMQRRRGLWIANVKCMLTASYAVKEALVAAGYPEQLIRVLSLPAGPRVAGIEYNLAHRKLQVVFASRFETYKGVDLLIALVKRLPQVSFVAVGGGSHEARLRELAKKHANLVVYARMTPQEVWHLFGSSACVIVPSQWAEPFGLVALGALAMGTPAIVSRLGGLPEIVEHGVSGFVVDPYDIKQWTRRIGEVLRDHATKKGKDMRTAAQARARDIGDPVRYSDALEETYIQAISRKIHL